MKVKMVQGGFKGTVNVEVVKRKKTGNLLVVDENRRVIFVILG
jgi:hypothetical protein